MVHPKCSSGPGLGSLSPALSSIKQSIRMTPSTTEPLESFRILWPLKTRSTPALPDACIWISTPRARNGRFAVRSGPALDFGFAVCILRTSLKLEYSSFNNAKSEEMLQIELSNMISYFHNRQAFWALSSQCSSQMTKSHKTVIARARQSRESWGICDHVSGADQSLVLAPALGTPVKDPCLRSAIDRSAL
jgi:hypothetical protein